MKALMTSPMTLSSPSPPTCPSILPRPRNTTTASHHPSQWISPLPHQPASPLQGSARGPAHLRVQPVSLDAMSATRIFSHPLRSALEPEQVPPPERNFSEPLFPLSGWPLPVRNNLSIPLFPPRWFVPPFLSSSTGLTFRRRITVTPWTSIRPTISTPERSGFLSRTGMPLSPTLTRSSITLNLPLVQLRLPLHQFQSSSGSDAHIPQNPSHAHPSTSCLRPHHPHHRCASWNASSAPVSQAETPSPVSIVWVFPPASVQDGQFSLQLDQSILSPKQSLHIQP